MSNEASSNYTAQPSVGLAASTFASEESTGTAPNGQAPDLKPLGQRRACAYADATWINGHARIITPEDVIGDDDREPIHPTDVWPYRATGQLIVRFERGERCIGTGTMVGKRHVLTAAHNVYDADLGGAIHALFVPARDGEETPYGYTQAVDIWYPPAYAEGDDSADYALIFLAEDVGIRVGHYKVQPHDPGELLKQEVTIAGYPIDMPGAGKNMWAARNLVAYADANFVHYIVDTGRGQSGAGVFFKDPKTGVQHLVAIHSEGHGKYNRGVRITSEIFRNCFSRISATP